MPRRKARRSSTRPPPAPRHQPRQRRQRQRPADARGDADAVGIGGVDDPHRTHGRGADHPQLLRAVQELDIDLLRNLEVAGQVEDLLLRFGQVRGGLADLVQLRLKRRAVLQQGLIGRVVDRVLLLQFLFLQGQRVQLRLDAGRLFQQGARLVVDIDRLLLLAIGVQRILRLGHRAFGDRQLFLDELQAVLRLGRAARDVLRHIGPRDGIQDALGAPRVGVGQRHPHDERPDRLFGRGKALLQVLDGIGKRGPSDQELAPVRAFQFVHHQRQAAVGQRQALAHLAGMFALVGQHQDIGAGAGDAQGQRLAQQRLRDLKLAQADAFVAPLERPQQADPGVGQVQPRRHHADHRQLPGPGKDLQAQFLDHRPKHHARPHDLDLGLARGIARGIAQQLLHPLGQRQAAGPGLDLQEALPGTAAATAGSGTTPGSAPGTRSARSSTCPPRRLP
jgi:hypothetical protein